MKKLLLFTTCLVFATAFLAINTTKAQSCKFIRDSVDHGFNGETFGVKLGDIDGDGDLDAVTFDAYDSLELWYNNGSGHFTDSTAMIWGSDWYYGIEMADLDADNDSDLVVMAFGFSANTTVLKNDGNGNFTVYQSISTDDTEESKLADLDNDGDVDLFSTGYTPEVWLNNGYGSFTSNGTISTMYGEKNDVALADFDGDGDKDAFMSDDNGSDNELWLNDGSGNFSYSASYGNSQDFPGIDAADFDNDGDQDVVIVGQNHNAEIWLNDGSGSFSFGSYLVSSNYDKSVVVDDFDQDGDVDIFISTYGSNGLEVWQNDGNANFSSYYTNTSSISSHDLDVGDLNGDGLTDIYVGNFSSNNGDVVFFRKTPGTIKNYNYTLCEGGSITVNNQTYDSTGQYTQQYACDSLININLDIIHIDTNTAVNGCQITAQDSGHSYQWLNCSDNYTPIPGETGRSFTPSQTGYYAVAISDSFCNDTSSCHHITVNPQVISYQFAVCEGQSISINGQTYDSTGTYTQNYGCDSVVNIDLNVISIDTSVTKSGQTLTANSSGLLYQWVDCEDNFAPVPGATNQSFTPDSVGRYAVIITDSICSDTSSCYAITGTGISTNTGENRVSIYPNPARDQITIIPRDKLSISRVILTDIRGSELIIRKDIHSAYQMDISRIPEGVYLLKMMGNDFGYVRKIVISR